MRSSKGLPLTGIRDGHVVVEVALESLLRQWRELAGWLRAQIQHLKDADIVERAAAGWESSGRNPAWLQEGIRLARPKRGRPARLRYRDAADTHHHFRAGGQGVEWCC